MLSVLNCQLQRSLALAPGTNFMTICRGMKLCVAAEQKVFITNRLQKMIDREGRSKPKKKKSRSRLTEYDFAFNLNATTRDTPVKTKAFVPKERSQRTERLDGTMFQHVQEIIQNQELDSRINDFNVQIVKVQMSRDLSGVNVYWAGSLDDRRNEEIREILDRNASNLRRLLIERAVIGHIPHVTFVKDKSQAYLQSLDTLLETADYGPEFNPAGVKKVRPVEERELLNTSLSNNGIYGLDHDAISKRLRVSMEKVKKRSKGRGAEIEEEEEKEEEVGKQIEKLKEMKKAFEKEKRAKKKMIHQQRIAEQNLLLEAVEGHIRDKGKYVVEEDDGDDYNDDDYRGYSNDEFEDENELERSYDEDLDGDIERDVDRLKMSFKDEEDDSRGRHRFEKGKIDKVDEDDDEFEDDDDDDLYSDDEDEDLYSDGEDEEDLFTDEEDDFEDGDDFEDYVDDEIQEFGDDDYEEEVKRDMDKYDVHGEGEEDARGQQLYEEGLKENVGRELFEEDLMDLDDDDNLSDGESDK